MDNKKITLIDSSRIQLDEISKVSSRKTDIKIYNSETGELVFRGCNKIIVPGAAFTARAHFDISSAEITPSYNTALALENSVYQTPSSSEKVYLFCVGVDGCGRENSQVYTENYAKWIAPESLVPFRYPLTTEDVASSLRDTYFGRKVIGQKVAYYFKAFDAIPEFIQQYIDGTPIGSDIYSNQSETEVESYIEVKLKITKDECREFFIATTGINDARINTISLCTAWAKEISGNTYYQDIRPLTKLNIPNEALIDLTKGIDITYHIYY